MATAAGLNKEVLDAMLAGRAGHVCVCSLDGKG